MNKPQFKPENYQQSSEHYRLICEIYRNSQRRQVYELKLKRVKK